MTISKEAKSLGMSWEKEYGYSQAVKVDNTIYVSGQVSHDDKGNIVGQGNMEAQPLLLLCVLRYFLFE
jgi:2-iminobutanoate/2-iminopropanoate deaminase